METSAVYEERKKQLVREMYELLASTSAEMLRLEDVMNELIKTSDDKDTTQLVMMSVNIREYRLKFKNMTKAIFDKKFNIVELCRRLHNKS